MEQTTQEPEQAGPSRVEELTGARGEESESGEPNAEQGDGDDLWQQDEHRRTPELS